MNDFIAYIEYTNTAVSVESEVIPDEFSLEQNYPNPFNPITRIKYTLIRSGDVSLTIYNLLGKEVIRLVDGYQPAGEYNISWDAANLASGIYFYRLQALTTSSGQAGEFVLTRKMVLLK